MYYVNCGGDYYIYRIKDGVKELAVEIPAKRLFTRDGKLYFMVETYNKYKLDEGMKIGNVLCYDPITGDIMKIIDIEASSIIVYEEGIYCKIVTLPPIMNGKLGTPIQQLYFYSFETQELVELEHGELDFIKWNGYFLYQEYKEDDTSQMVLTNLEKTDMIPLNQKANWRYAIEDDKLYMMISSNVFQIIDLNTMEKSEIKLIYDGGEDFVKIGSKVYFATMVILDLETKEQTIVKQELKEVEGLTWKELYDGLPYALFTEMYTDGEKLYTYHSTFETNGKYNVYGLYEIQLIDSEYGPLETTNAGGNPMEILRYEYRLVPVWEE